MSDLAFHIVGLEVVVTIKGPQVTGLFGSYEFYPPKGTKPDVRIELEVVPELGEGVEEGPTYPAFETLHFSDTELLVSRRCARGHIEISPDGTLVARFQSNQLASGLEAAIRIAVSLALPHNDALILHSSSVTGPQGALVFSGLSGAGKSTISTMLASHYGVQKLSDELLIVSKATGAWRVHVAPFKGAEGLPHGISQPLHSVDFLVQAPSHCRTPLSPAQAMEELFRHVVTYARAPKTTSKTLDLIADLVTSVPCHELKFTKDPSVGEVLGITCSEQGAQLPWVETDVP